MEQEDLKKKYKQPRIDRIKMYCASIKSIGLATNLKITVEKKHKNIIEVSLSADPHSPKEALGKALGYVIGEFIKVMWGTDFSDKEVKLNQFVAAIQ